MNNDKLLLLGGLAAVAYFMLTKPANAAAAGAPVKGLSPMATKGGVRVTIGNASAVFGGKLAAPQTQALAAQANMANPGGSAVKPASSSIGARDVAGIAGGVAAAAGCNAIPGAGTALSPLCGMAGNVLGQKAYDYGKEAVGYIGGLF